jgi:hypothetical protein
MAESITFVVEFVSYRLLFRELDFFTFQVNSFCVCPLEFGFDLLNDHLESFYLMHEFFHTRNIYRIEVLVYRRIRLAQLRLLSLVNLVDVVDNEIADSE